MELLPAEIIVIIATNCSPRDAGRFAITCREFTYLLTEPLIFAHAIRDEIGFNITDVDAVRLMTLYKKARTIASTQLHVLSDSYSNIRPIVDYMINSVTFKTDKYLALCVMKLCLMNLAAFADNYYAVISRIAVTFVAGCVKLNLFNVDGSEPLCGLLLTLVDIEPTPVWKTSTHYTEYETDLNKSGKLRGLFMQIVRYIVQKYKRKNAGLIWMLCDDSRFAGDMRRYVNAVIYGVNDYYDGFIRS